MTKLKHPHSTKIFIAIGILLIIAGCTYYLTTQYQTTNDTVVGITNPGDTHTTIQDKDQTDAKIIPISVDTKKWKTYSNTSFDITFKYPAERPVDVVSNQINNLVLTLGDYITVNARIKPANFTSLQNSVKSLVDLSKKDLADATPAVSVTYASTTVGTTHGFLITRTAADSVRSTDSTYETEIGKYIVDISYSYEGYILDQHPETILAGGPETPDFVAKLAADRAGYDTIQGIISTIQAPK